MDFITDLPPDTGWPSSGSGTDYLYDTILTVTCQFSKAKILIPGHKDWKTADWATAFSNQVIPYWGLLKVSISDRDKRFMNGFWHEVYTKVGVHQLVTTSYHPSADGQSERTNVTLEIALRYLVDANQKGWVKALPTIQGELNASLTSPTGHSPNKILYGFDLHQSLGLIDDRDNPAAADFIEHQELIQWLTVEAIDLANAAMESRNDPDLDQDDYSSGWAHLKLHNGLMLPSI